MSKTCLLFSAIVFSISTFAQVKDKDLGSEHIDLYGGFNPVISDASKIGKNPVINDSTAKLPIKDYNLIDKKINTSFEVDPIPAAKMKGEPLTKLYRTHIKGGFGNYATPLGEIYFNSLRSKEFSYLAYLKHISSTGSIPNTFYNGFSKTGTGLSGKHFKKSHTISGDFNYDRNVMHYYGIPGVGSQYYPLSTTEISKDVIRQRFNLFSAATEVQSTYKDSSKLHHHFKLKYNNYADLFDTAIENNLRLDGRVGFYHGKELISVDVMTDYYKNSLPSDTTFNAIINVGPNKEIVSKGKKWRIKVGGDFFAGVATDEIGSFHFYPDVDFNFNLIDNIIIPYMGINGQLERNSYRLLTGINPFMSAYAPLKNTNTLYNIYGGLRGSASSKITFNVGAAYKKVKDMAFFINDPEEFFPERFTAVYDDVTILNFTGEIAYQKTEKLKLLLKGDYFSYTMTNELHAWYRPDLEITFTSFYSLRDKIILKADVFYMGSRYGTRPFDIYGTQFLAGSFPEKLKGFADVNLGVEYRYTKQLSAFINFNNIGAASYSRWYNYPMQRFNLLGGFSYSF
ncbi:MAG: hypothetical protein M3Q58_07995 [Bacteroidota bacterium]|nr:hypothetical protein [Bacteroidota bacterium]